MLGAPRCAWYERRPVVRGSAARSTWLWDRPRALLLARWNGAGTPALALWTEPAVVVFDAAVKDEDVDELLKVAEPDLEKTKVVDDNGVEVNDTGRDSETAFVNHGDDKSVAGRVADVVTKLAGFPGRDYAEAVEVNRYQVGGRFSIHYDFLSEQGVNDGSDFAGCQRVATALLYMTTVSRGGETVFVRKPSFKGGFDDVDVDNPDHAKVKPVKGKVVVWYNVHPFTEVEDKRTWHGGAPVEEGVKVAASVYIRNCSFSENRKKVQQIRAFRDWKPNVSVAVEEGADKKEPSIEDEVSDTDDEFDDELSEEDLEILKELEAMDEKDLDEEDREVLRDLRERKEMAEKMREEAELDEEELEMLRELEEQDEKKMADGDREMLMGLRKLKQKQDAKAAAKSAAAGAAAAKDKGNSDPGAELEQVEENDDDEDEGDDDDDDDEDDNWLDEGEDWLDEGEDGLDEDDEDDDRDDKGVFDNEEGGDVADMKQRDEIGGNVEDYAGAEEFVDDDLEDEEAWMREDDEALMREDEYDKLVGQQEDKCGCGGSKPAVEDLFGADEEDDDEQCEGDWEDPFGHEGFQYFEDAGDGEWEEFGGDDEDFVPMDGGGKVIPPPMEPIDDVEDTEIEKEEL